VVSRSVRTAVLATALGLAVFASSASAATITVGENTDGSMSELSCTLRDAVNAANTNLPAGYCNAGSGSSDTIVLTGGETYTLSKIRAGGPEDNNVDGDLDIAEGQVTITTSGGLATIDGDGTAQTLAKRDRVIQVLPTAGGLTLQKVRVQNGWSTTGFGGGGILSQAPLTVVNSEIVGNHLENPALAAFGGGVYERGSSLTMTGSTVAGNSALSVGTGNSTFGGGIAVYSPGASVSLTNTTVSGNSVAATVGGLQGFGAGAYLGDPSTPIPGQVTNVTIAGNDTGQDSLAGGLRIGGPTVTGSVIAQNTASDGPADCQGSVVSGGGNVVGEQGTFEPCAFTGPGDISGTEATPLDPKVGGLVLNEGLTRTRILNPGSPAIDRGGTCPATDQTGRFRFAGGPCDAGAYEVGASLTPPPVSPAPLPGPTGRRAAALKKCKKKHSKKKRKKCKKAALKLPV
jgi:hypothetical protein